MFDSMFKMVRGLWLQKDANDVLDEAKEKQLKEFKIPEGVARRSFLQAMGITSTTVFLGGTTAAVAAVGGEKPKLDLWAGSTWQPEGTAPKKLLWGEDLTIALKEAGINDVTDADQLKMKSFDVVDSAFSAWFVREMQRHVGSVTTRENLERISAGLTSAAKVVFGADNQHVKTVMRLSSEANKPRVIAGVDRLPCNDGGHKWMTQIRYADQAAATLKV